MKGSIWAVTLACTLIAAFPAEATDFTLSDSAILSLDYNLQDQYSPPPTSSIVSEQDIPGTGVQLSIHFPSTNWPDYFRFQVSDSRYGAGTLTTINVSRYAHFDLKFTLVSIDGSAFGSQLMEVGAMTRDGYKPEVTSLTGFDPPSAVSTMTVYSATINDIGFYVSMLTWAGSVGGWSDGPHDVTLLVQPADGAVQIPEPATWTFVALGAVALLGSARLRRR